MLHSWAIHCKSKSSSSHLSHNASIAANAFPISIHHTYSSSTSVQGSSPVSIQHKMPPPKPFSTPSHALTHLRIHKPPTNVPPPFSIPNPSFSIHTSPHLTLTPSSPSSFTPSPHIPRYHLPIPHPKPKPSLYASIPLKHASPPTNISSRGQIVPNRSRQLLSPLPSYICSARASSQPG